jgi:CheY-like chemotaxis protein
MGKIRLEMHPISIAPVISAILESVRATAEAKGITLHTNVSANSGTTRADANRIQQIAWNLLSNAIKFTPTGGHVFVDVRRDEHYVELRVRDTGVGISPEFLPHVFERFRQADSSVTRPHSGVGLGLSIVQHLAELHGGSVDVSSEGLNRGATFWIRLPLLATTTVPAVTGEPPESPLLRGVRVLVVDDDQDARELLTVALGETGAHVTTADSAARAFELLMAQGADVLVSDIAMPGEDGLSLIRRVRAIPGNTGRTPAIALTAYPRAHDRTEAFDAGYQIHLTKPVELRELQAELAKLAVQHGHDVLGN